MTFYQELQLNQAGSKSLLKNSKTMKEKLYHAFVYMVKIAVTMVFCFAFVTASSIILGKDNSIVGVVVLLCVMVFRNADLGIHTGPAFCHFTENLQKHKSSTDFYTLAPPYFLYFGNDRLYLRYKILRNRMKNTGIRQKN